MEEQLVEARRGVLEALRAALELQLRLLHSTETDPAVVAREHDAFCDILSRLASHPQRPHIQRFSDMNRDEFVRVELEFLTQFSADLKKRASAVGRLLLIKPTAYQPERDWGELLDLMAEPTRNASPLQFNDSQRSGVLALLEPNRFYGQKISGLFGAGESHLPEPPPEDSTVPEAASPNRDVDTDSFLRMKAGVLADNVRHYQKSNEGALAMALLKVKRWLAVDGNAAGFAPDAGSDVTWWSTRAPEGLHLLTSDPRSLVFAYVSATGSRALFSVGLSNEAMRGMTGAPVPELGSPCVCLLLSDASGAQVGFAYAAANDPGESRVDQLARLIKKLDFSAEYLRLTALERPPGAEQAEATDAWADELMRLAMEL